MLLRFLILFSFLFLVKSSFTQEVFLKINQEKNQKINIKLKGFYGNETYLIDSLVSKSKNTQFIVKNNQFYEGFYRLIINDSLGFDFILTKSDTIEFVFNTADFYNTLEIYGSHDNQLLFQLKKELSTMNNQINYLKSVEVYDSLSYYAVKNGVLQLKKEKNKKLDFYAETFKNKVFSYLAIMNKEIVSEGKKAALQEYLSYLNFSNESLIRTNIYPIKIVDFFALYFSPEESSFKTACDTLLKHASVNPVVYNYTLYFLLKLFSEIGPEVIFQYLLTDHYLKNACDLDLNNEELGKRITKFTNILPGNISPALTGSNLAGKYFTSEKLISKHKKTIYFFWNPDCYYCKQIIPELIKSYPSLLKNNISIISFAITTDKIAWKTFSEEFKFPWPDLSDLKGWDSPIVSDFMVTKSPFIIVVDKNSIILEFDFKVSNISQL